MITKKIQIYTNRITTDLIPYLTVMFQYYQKHGVTLNYDITPVNVNGYQSNLTQTVVGNVYTLQGAENLVPQTDHDIVMFVFDLNEWKAPWWYPYQLWGNIPRDSTYMANGKPFINIGFLLSDINNVQQRLLHEPMHALAKIFGCTDQMDTYVNDNNPDSPVGNFATQWSIFKPYLNTTVGIQQSTLDLIAVFEGFRAQPYQDATGHWTIGIGFRYIEGIPVKETTPSITLQQAEAELKIQLVHYAAAVTSAIKVLLTQNQFDACVSLCYNIGTGGFTSSTVVRDINSGNIPAAADAFLLWDIPAVLITRRERERALFLS